MANARWRCPGCRLHVSFFAAKLVTAVNQVAEGAILPACLKAANAWLAVGERR